MPMETVCRTPLTSAPWSGVRSLTVVRLQWLRLGFDDWLKTPLCRNSVKEESRRSRPRLDSFSFTLLNVFPNVRRTSESAAHVWAQVWVQIVTICSEVTSAVSSGVIGNSSTRLTPQPPLLTTKTKSVVRRGGAESDVFLPSPELKWELPLQFRRGAGGEAE
jgi:hypothetical protein